MLSDIIQSWIQSTKCYLEKTAFVSFKNLKCCIKPNNVDLFFTYSQDDQDYHPGRRKRGKDYKEGMVG